MKYLPFVCVVHVLTFDFEMIWAFFLIVDLVLFRLFFSFTSSSRFSFGSLSSLLLLLWLLLLYFHCFRVIVLFAVRCSSKLVFIRSEFSCAANGWFFGSLFSPNNLTRRCNLLAYKLKRDTHLMITKSPTILLHFICILFRFLLFFFVVSLIGTIGGWFLFFSLSIFF